MIRNRVENLVMKQDGGSIVIGGGGFAGTEFAGELHNLLKHECEEHGKQRENFKILVVEGATGFLSGLSEKVAGIVSRRLSQMGIETKFSSLITDVASDHIMINMKERINCDLLIWTGGVRSIRLPIDVDLERDKKDRTAVTEFLNLKNFSNVFLAGDNSGALNIATKKPVAQTAQEAMAQGQYVAKNIYRLIKNKPLLYYHAHPIRFVIPVGGKYAILYTPNLIIAGFFGWVIRKAADFRYFWSVLPFWSALKYWIFENKIFMKND